MTTIFKYPLGKPMMWFDLLLPRDAEFLSVQVQNNTIVAWFKVIDPSVLKETQEFILVGTGQELEKVDVHSDSQYLGTVQHGPFVWHLFKNQRGGTQ